MSFFQFSRKLLPLATAMALLIGGNATKSWAAVPRTTEEKTVPDKTERLVDINTATVADLEDVPGIGPSYAKKIIANRPYANVKELSKTGIPAARLEKVLPLLTVQKNVTQKGKPAGRAKPTALVDINTATAAQLEDVPGIGPAYAKKIIAGRPYASVAELSKTGIPASRLERILPLVTVSQQPAASEKPAERANPAGRSTKTTKTSIPAETTPIEGRTPPKQGMVWANPDSKIYHLEGDRWYGKTKKGEWMTEEDALKAGYRRSK